MSIESESGKWWPFVVVVLLVLVILGLLGWAVWLAFPKLDQRGQFGDMFGSVNALFSGLAFAGVIYTLVLQQRELALQRKELRETRNELRKQAMAATDQAETALLAAKINAYGSLLNAESIAKASNRKTDVVAMLQASFGKSIDAKLRESLSEIDRRLKRKPDCAASQAQDAGNMPE